MRPILAIADVELRRYLADKSNLFFMLVFPLALVAVIGLQFGGSGDRGTVSLVAPDGALRSALVEQWEEAGLRVDLADDVGQMQQAVARGQSQVGVAADAADEEAFGAGGSIPLEIISGSGSTTPAVAEVVRAEAETVAARAAQAAALREAGLGEDAGGGDAGGSDGRIEAALEQARTEVPGPRMTVQEPENPLAREFAGLTQFGQGAASQLLLFVFLNTLAAASSIIQARRQGVIRRTMAAPVTTGQTVLGLALGRLAIALFQGVYIMVATALLFGVSWGNLWVVALIVLVLGLIASGLAMLVGVVFDHEGAATGVTIGVGLVMGALGGLMVPLELFPDSLRTLAHFTPHAWAYEAVAEVQRRGAGVLEILPELGVLTAMAVGVLILGALFLRRSLSRAI